MLSAEVDNILQDLRNSFHLMKASSIHGYNKVVTNQSAANFVSTNQNRAFGPCDFLTSQIKVLTHVTPRNKEHTHTRVESTFFT